MIAVIALVAYLVTTIGVPLPAHVSKGTTPFPCQHHACGCATAHECWDHCCCYSPREKLAWARDHHVEPPAKLVAEVAALELEPLLASDAKAAPARKSCCAKPHAHASAHTDHHEHAPHTGTDCDDHEDGDHDGDDSLEFTFVLGVQARQCRGLTDFWCATGAVAPPPHVEWQYQWTVVEWLVLAPVPLPLGDFSPPVPPPRV